MKYAWISRHRKHYNLDSMCQTLDVSRSGYLASFNRPMSPRERNNRKLIIDIKQYTIVDEVFVVPLKSKPIWQIKALMSVLIGLNAYDNHTGYSAFTNANLKSRHSRIIVIL